MEPQREERRLTTILAADVVGYSRLMATDESGTLAQLKTHRKELIEPKTANSSTGSVSISAISSLRAMTSTAMA